MTSNLLSGTSTICNVIREMKLMTSSCALVATEEDFLGYARQCCTISRISIEDIEWLVTCYFSTEKSNRKISVALRENFLIRLKCLLACLGRQNMFLRLFSLKTGIHFAYFGLESSIVF